MNRPVVRLCTVGLRKESEICDLPDEFQQVRPARFDKSGTQKNIVVDIVHPDGQTPQRKLSRIGRKVDSRRIPRGEHGYALSHNGSQRTQVQNNKGTKYEQDGEANPLTAKPTPTPMMMRTG